MLRDEVQLFRRRLVRGGKGNMPSAIRHMESCLRIAATISGWFQSGPVTWFQATGGMNWTKLDTFPHSYTYSNGC